MINFKKVAKAVGVVLLVFFLAILGYTFTPLLAILVIALESVTVVLMQLMITLAILVVVKVLFQILTGQKIQTKIPEKLGKKLKTLKKQIS